MKSLDCKLERVSNAMIGSILLFVGLVFILPGRRFFAGPAQRILCLGNPKVAWNCQELTIKFAVAG
jgi:hypothetical protein